MFRRRKQWHHPGDFPTASVQRLPFQRHYEENKIYYTTRYEPHNSDKCGIFEYDLETQENRCLKLWKDIDYFPRWDVTVYSESDDTIFFVGGANVKNHHRRYDLLVIYNIEKDELTKYKFPSLIGGNARCCLSNDDKYLHIVGGTSNNHHILYDIAQRKVNYMYSFYEMYRQFQACGLMHSSLTNQLFLFGGRSSAQRLSFDDFYCLDLNNPLSKLSMKEATWLLINGWIVEEMYYKLDNDVVDYPVELNDLILDFIGIDNTIHCWQKQENWKMPAAIYQFGYVLYKQRVLITFGGRDESNECIDSIYYLDTFNKSDGWKQCKYKCPKASTYNALLMDDEIVHIVPFYVHKDHFTIPIKKLLPKRFIEQIEIDIDLHEHIGMDSPFGMEYKQLLKLHSQYIRNKIIISILIGIIITCIGLILYIKADPYYAGVLVMSAGILTIIVGIVYARFHRPSQPEYLLY